MSRLLLQRLMMARNDHYNHALGQTLLSLEITIIVSAHEAFTLTRQPMNNFPNIYTILFTFCKPGANPMIASYHAGVVNLKTKMLFLL
jgi:hypothetical protein